MHTWTTGMTKNDVREYGVLIEDLEEIVRRLKVRKSRVKSLDFSCLKTWKILFKHKFSLLNENF